MTSEFASNIPPTATPLSVMPNQKLMRSVRITRVVMVVILLTVAALESDPVGRGLACFAAFWWGVSALVVPRAGKPYVVATEAGLESSFFGLLTWDDIAAVRVRQRRRVRSLEIYDRDRSATIQRAPPRLLQFWMLLTRPFHLPLLRITERMSTFDAAEFRSELERLAGRTFPEC